MNAVAQWASAHHGLITLDALTGKPPMASRSAWYRAIADGRLVPLHPGVARLPGVPETREQRIAAAVLAAGRGAMASHRSAAHLWGVPRPDDDPVDVILPVRDREASLDGVVVHRPRDRRDLSPVVRSGIRTTNVLRFLCDLGAVDPPSVHAAVGHVLLQTLARPDDLRRAIDVHARRGRHGVPAFRAALADWMLDGKPADSVLELAMRRLLTRHGLPPAEFHARIAGYEVDFWLIGTPVVLECDGWAYHGRTKAQHHRDTVRDNDLVVAGYLPVHFTYRMVHRTPADVARRIRGALTRWSPGWRPVA